MSYDLPAKILEDASGDEFTINDIVDGEVLSRSGTNIVGITNRIVQVDISTSTASFSTSNTHSIDDTPPQKTEMSSALLTVSLTSIDTSNDILVIANGTLGLSGTNHVTLGIFIDGNNSAQATTRHRAENSGTGLSMTAMYLDTTPPSSETYELRIGAAGGTTYLNRDGNGNDLQNVATLIAMEIDLS